ncbi:hypothetical protein [Streptomyces sp. NPDC001508]|uniref:hypothetical protein n=1 Tax=Streptomyces sp. NPDC001508 TaxID=3154656 RepID=UPI00332E95B9
MALTDRHDVFIGSTDDGWTFVVLNRPIHGASRILTGAGFTARRHQGRTLYLLPPDTAEDAHERAGVAVYGLMSHTLVDLAWTTRQPTADGTAEPEVVIRFAGTTVTATAATDQAASVLVQHGFLPGVEPRHFALPSRLGEHEALQAVVHAEAHLYTQGISVRIHLGMATVEDIPPAPNRPGSTPVRPADAPPKRRTH